MKTCRKCLINKELIEFNKDPSKSDGLTSYCKPCRKIKSRNNYLKNSSKIKENTNKYYKENKNNVEFKLKRKKYRKELFETDLNYKLARRLRNRLYYALKNKGWKKSCKFSTYIGCNYETLIKHFESKFKEGMSWDNYGKWHIDHVIPLNSARDEQDIIKLSHYTNLQPLWASDNLKKADSIDFSLYTVKPIQVSEARDMLLNIHYLKSIPSISYCYGLFINNDLIGVCTYGIPFSKGIRYMLGLNHRVLEMNRLVLKYNQKNEASFFISKTITMLPDQTIIISFADPSVGHSGTIYKASNFNYYGLTEKRKNMQLLNSNKHALTVYDQVNSKQSDFKLVDRTQKHRYIYIKGNKKYRKTVEALLEKKFTSG